MAEVTLYYATNRRHRGERWKPTSYSGEPSKDGIENLRFGKVVMPVVKAEVDKELKRDTGFGIGHGEKLAKYLHKQRRKATIHAFEERLDKFESDSRQDPKHFGSSQTFTELQTKMAAGCDVLVFIHGFNVSWWQAVSSALALQMTLNRSREGVAQRPVQVVLFTWPSDGRAIPYWSYFSDRGDASGSGDAVGRGVLKLRDYLIKARREARRQNEPHCLAGIHLLCHSMGNYVLQHAVALAKEFSPGGKLPRLFDHVFLCAPDVADDVLESGEPLASLPETSEVVTLYHNRGDLAMPVSDHTKGNSDRLGWRGASRPGDLDGRVHQVDCSPIVTGFVEHSYFLCGRVNDDIAASIAKVPPDSPERKRSAVRNGWPNIWRME